MWITRNIWLMIVTITVLNSVSSATKKEDKKTKDKRQILGTGDGYFYGRPLNKPVLSYDLPQQLSYPNFIGGYHSLPFNTYGYAGGYDDLRAPYGSDPEYIFKRFNGPIDYTALLSGLDLSQYNSLGANNFNFNGFKSAPLAITPSPIYGTPTPAFGFSTPAPPIAYPTPGPIIYSTVAPSLSISSPAPIYGTPAPVILHSPAPLLAPAFNSYVSPSFLGGSGFGNSNYQSNKQDFDRTPEYAQGIKSLSHFKSVPVSRLRTSVASGNAPLRFYPQAELFNAANNGKIHDINTYVSSTVATPTKGYLPPITSTL